jgi:hypothetical protein
LTFAYELVAKRVANVKSTPLADRQKHTINEKWRGFPRRWSSLP